MKRNVLILALSFIFLSLIAQDSKLPVFISDSLENYISKGMADWGIPGLSVAIVKDGEIVFMKGYGVTQVGGEEVVDENTLFMIGSNTKIFTATAITILEQAGAISLNDKVRKWMPDFALKDSLASKEINIADLLSHRIGFETFQGDFTYWTSSLSREEVIQKMSLIDAPYDFRTRWGYCNAAFVTAGELIPRIIGKTWEETIRDSILIPLGMDRTLMLSEELQDQSNAAFSHTIVDNAIVEMPFANIDNLAPAASMSSSASDMSKWLFAQINGGKIDTAQVISRRAIQAPRRPYSILGVDPRDKKETHFYLYGLGLIITDCDGKLVYSHTGGVNGFVSSVMFIPEEKLGIVVLTNTDQNNFYSTLTNEIRDAFLGLPYKNYSDKSYERYKNDKIQANTLIDSLKNLVELKNRPSLKIGSYAGKYHNEVYGDIDIVVEKKKLNIYFSNHPNLIGHLEHLQDDNYLCTYTDPIMGIVEIPFNIVDDEVTGLTLRVNDFVEFLPYNFIKED